MSPETALAKKDPMGAALATFDPSRYNLCAPVTALDQVPEMHRISVRVVQVNPETETYPIPGQADKVGIGKVALDKLASAANIQWVPNQCGRIDDRKDPHFVTYRAVGVMRNFDGETRVISAEKTLDFRGKPGAPEAEMGADTLEIVRVAAKKSRDPWPQVAQCRQQIHSLAESKAKNRAIRQALAVPVALPKAEVAKPFVIPALVLAPDMSDPDVKRAAIAHMFGASAALYGAPPALQPVPEPINITPEPADPGLLDGEYVNGDGVIHEAPEEPTFEDEPTACTPPVKIGLPVSPEILAALPDKRRQFFATLINPKAQAVWDKYGPELGRDHLAACIPVSFDPATMPATEINKLNAALKALV